MRLSRLFGKSPKLEDASQHLVQATVSVGSDLPSYEQAVGSSKDEKYDAAKKEPRTPSGSEDHWQKGQWNEDELTILKDFKVVIIVDDSGSMSLPASSGHLASPSLSRWKLAQEAIGQLAETAIKYSQDGLDIDFLNNSDRQRRNVKSAKDVRNMFAFHPAGHTFIGSKLDALLCDYIAELEAERKRGKRKSVKKICYLVITDGEPSDKVDNIIVKHANRLTDGGFPDDQVGIQFVQIGDDRKAAEFLRKLDDELSPKYNFTNSRLDRRAARDMVDTTPYVEGQELSATRLIKVLIGGINRKRDRMQLRPDQ